MSVKKVLDQGISAYALPGLKSQYRFPVSVNTSDRVNYIRHIVEESFQLDRKVVEGKLRERQAVNCRHVTFYLLRRYTSLSYKAIGRLFGGRDHSTVMHAMEKIQDVMQTDSDLRDTVHQLEFLLQKEKY